MVIFVQLCKLHLLQREAASSQSIDNLTTLPKAADRKQFTSIQLKCDAAQWKGQSGVPAKRCYSETASDDHTALQQCGEWHASLKPPVLFPDHITHIWNDPSIHYSPTLHSLPICVSIILSNLTLSTHLCIHNFVQPYTPYPSVYPSFC